MFVVRYDRDMATFDYFVFCKREILTILYTRDSCGHDGKLDNCCGVYNQSIN